MKKYIFLIASFLILNLAYASDTGNIVVFGEAENSVLSDEWQLNLEFAMKERTRDNLIKEYNKTKEEVYKKLSSFGIKEADIKTQGFALSPWYEWENNSNVKKGYQLSHSISLKRDKFEVMNKIIVALTPINGINIGYMAHMLKTETREKEMNKLYAKAYASAMTKIQALLDASGKKLKRIEMISEDLNNSTAPMPMYDKAMNMMSKAAPRGAEEANINLSLVPLDVNLGLNLKVVAAFE